MSFTVRANVTTPDNEQTQQRIRFTTYLHYVKSFEQFLTKNSEERTLKSTLESIDLRRIQSRPEAPLEQIEKQLRNAWLTECQLSQHAENTEMVSVANHWAPVQLYYAVFLSAQAYTLASGQPLHLTHRSCLRLLASEIKSRPGLFALPWGVSCINATSNSEHGFVGLPTSVKLDRHSTLASPKLELFWNYYCQALRTTRERLIEECAKKWKKQNKRKRLPSGKRLKLDENFHPTTLFDFLYRLRIRSNYQDADSFLLTLEDTEAALEFNRALQCVGFWTCALLETLTSRYLGERRYGEIVTRYCRDAGPARSRNIQRRWKLCRTIVDS